MSTSRYFRWGSVALLDRGRKWSNLGLTIGYTEYSNHNRVGYRSPLLVKHKGLSVQVEWPYFSKYCLIWFRYCPKRWERELS